MHAALQTDVYRDKRLCAEVGMTEERKLHVHVRTFTHSEKHGGWVLGSGIRRVRGGTGGSQRHAQSHAGLLGDRHLGRACEGAAVQRVHLQTGDGTGDGDGGGGVHGIQSPEVRGLHPV